MRTELLQSGLSSTRHRGNAQRANIFIAESVTAFRPTTEEACHSDSLVCFVGYKTIDKWGIPWSPQMATKEELELQKLNCEIEKLKEEVTDKRKWFFVRPDWWSSNILAVVAVGGLIINMVTTNANLERAGIAKESALLDLKVAQLELRESKTELKKVTEDFKQLEHDLDAFSLTQTSDPGQITIEAIVLDEEGKPITQFRLGLQLQDVSMDTRGIFVDRNMGSIGTQPGQKVVKFYVEANGFQPYVIRPVRGFLPPKVMVKLKKAPGTHYFDITPPPPLSK